MRNAGFDISSTYYYVEQKLSDEDPQPKFIDDAKIRELLYGSSTCAHGSYPVKPFTRVVTYSRGKFCKIFACHDGHRLGFDEIICQM